jgi:tetratricopeptide (TPR) repeat protein
MKTTLTLRINLNSSRVAPARLPAADDPRPADADVEQAFFARGLEDEASGDHRTPDAPSRRRSGWLAAAGILALAASGTAAIALWAGRAASASMDAPAAAATAPAASAAAPVPAAPALAAPAPVALAPAPVAPAVVPAAAPVETLAPAEDLAAACTGAFDSRHWRDASAACARASDAQPADAALAMKAAHAEYNRGRAAAALPFAQRAATANPDEAEAYVLIGGAEQEAGNVEAAAKAYRQYLQLAPRGWHARDIRSVLANLRR